MSHMQTGGLALVIAPPGRLSDGWRALLMTTPHIAEVRQAPDATSALDVAETREPDLILVDVDALGERGWSALAQIKDERPYCRRWRRRGADQGVPGRPIVCGYRAPL
jgi:DNA-binding NarL/FixJ family response regulator